MVVFSSCSVRSVSSRYVAGGNPEIRNPPRSSVCLPQNMLPTPSFISSHLTPSPFFSSFTATPDRWASIVKAHRPAHRRPSLHPHLHPLHMRCLHPHPVQRPPHQPLHLRRRILHLLRRKHGPRGEIPRHLHIDEVVARRHLRKKANSPSRSVCSVTPSTLPAVTSPFVLFFSPLAALTVSRCTFAARAGSFVSPPHHPPRHRSRWLHPHLRHGGDTR